MPGIVSTFPVVVEHIEEFWGIITEELKKRWDPRPMIYKTKMNAYGGGGGAFIFTHIKKHESIKKSLDKSFAERTKVCFLDFHRTNLGKKLGSSAKLFRLKYALP